jgi:3-oxoacyl-[acyl-carrier protein] reductase
VVFNFARSVDQAAEVEQAVRDAGGHAHGVRVDLAGSGAVDELVSAAERYLDGLDILVNNAALGFTPTIMADIDETVYDAVMAVNTRSTFLTMRYAARRMRDNGRIITSRPLIPRVQLRVPRFMLRARVRLSS